MLDETQTSRSTPEDGLSEWAGVYATTTRWWDGYFSPLIVIADGPAVELAGTRLDFSYHDGVLSFDWQSIKTTKSKGVGIRFKKDRSDCKTFEGAIHPRPQDGPVEFAGKQVLDPRRAYVQARKTLMAEFFDPFVTADILKEVGWDDDDGKAATVLEELKKQVISQPGYYDCPWESEWFTSVRDKIAATDLFAFLKKMPKGAILHVHPTAMGDYSDLLDAAAAYQVNGKRFYVSERYREQPPGTLFVLAGDQPSGYIALANAMADPGRRRKVLETLTFANQDADYEGDIWDLFQPVFSRVSPLLRPAELEARYYRRAFQYLANEDNVSHVELRTSWRPANEQTEGKKEKIILDALEGLDLTLKAIWSDSRGVGKETDICDDICTVGRIMSEQPDGRVIGFDLVGEEDKGHPTYFFLDDLFKAYSKLGNSLPPMYFHDGESDLPPDYVELALGLRGTPSEDWFNNNLVDAYLTNTLTLSDFTFKTARVGHGIELFKTPALARYYQEAGICIELCPVSNQVLRYCVDIREHPGQAFLAGGIPVSLSPDDPAISGYQGVSHDFWEACIGWNLDLMSLKVLAYYSLKHSGLRGNQKTARIKQWREAWAAFVRHACES